MLIVKCDDGGDPALSKRFHGFNSRFVLGPIVQKKFKIRVVPACMVTVLFASSASPSSVMDSMSFLAALQNVCQHEIFLLWLHGFDSKLRLNTSKHFFPVKMTLAVGTALNPTSLTRNRQ